MRLPRERSWVVSLDGALSGEQTAPKRKARKEGTERQVPAGGQVTGERTAADDENSRGHFFNYTRRARMQTPHSVPSLTALCVTKLARGAPPRALTIVLRYAFVEEQTSCPAAADL